VTHLRCGGAFNDILTAESCGKKFDNQSAFDEDCSWFVVFESPCGQWFFSVPRVYIIWL